jgi:hypothetical protein
LHTLPDLAMLQSLTDWFCLTSFYNVIWIVIVLGLLYDNYFGAIYKDQFIWMRLMMLRSFEKKIKGLFVQNDKMSRNVNIKVLSDYLKKVYRLGLISTLYCKSFCDVHNVWEWIIRGCFAKSFVITWNINLYYNNGICHSLPLNVSTV